MHGILPFSKSYPEIESTWLTAKCKRRKFFDTWYYIVTFATFCACFSSKSKATVFPKHILKSRERDQSLQARKKLYCRVIVTNSLCNVLCRFLINIELRGRCKIKEQTLHLTSLYCGRTVRSSHQRCYIKKAVLKTFTIFISFQIGSKSMVANKLP